MAQLDIICNVSKCRKCLNKVAWVTSCSHAFCEEHGNKEFVENQNLPCRCPACDTSLGNKFDIVKVDLDPPEDFKSMVLAGLRPEILSDIFNRALTFWNYQICQEHMYQVVSLKKNKINLEKMSQYYESVEKKNNAQLESCEIALKNAQAEISVLQQKAEELISQLNAKTRQNNKMKQMYDSLRLNSLGAKISIEDSPRGNVRHRVIDDGFLKPRTPTRMRASPYNFQPRSNSLNRREQRSHSEERSVRPPDKGFVFRPVTPEGDYREIRLPPEGHSKRMRFEQSHSTPNDCHRRRNC